VKLVLDIIKSAQDSQSKRSLHLNKEGGVIGRSSDADWQLLDPKNYISNKHVHIEYQDNVYFIRDESTNGTYLKFPYKKLPKGNSIKINSTDIFILGEYEIQARFVEDDFSTDIMSQINALDQTQSKEKQNIGIIPDNDFLDEPFDSLETNATDIMNIVANANKTEDENTITNAVEVEYEITGEIDEHYINIPDASKEEDENISTITDTSLQRSLEVLEKKLGVKICSIENKDREALFEEIGNIVLNSLTGLKHSLYIKEKIKEEMNVLKADEKETQSNPILLGESASKLLRDKQLTGMLGFSKLSDAVLQSFDELDRHNIALHSSTKNLMNVTMRKFSPTNLEYYFEKKGALRGIFKPKKIKLWKAYQTMFHELEETPEVGVELIAKELEREYKSNAYGVSLATQQRVK
jgi:type VI secretion system protein ImpI